ncbi:hypothetical protein HDU96_007939 [Phlyctochytrium bullatum]|nr:hypothetical protein HDU96_007939 [Phlyctochytrium bullatum]
MSEGPEDNADIEELEQRFRAIVRLDQVMASCRTPELVYDYENLRGVQDPVLGRQNAEMCIAALEMRSEFEALEREFMQVFDQVAPKLEAAVEAGLASLKSKCNDADDFQVPIEIPDDPEKVQAMLLDRWLSAPMTKEFYPPPSPANFDALGVTAAVVPQVPGLKEKLKMMAPPAPPPLAAPHHIDVDMSPTPQLSFPSSGIPPQPQPPPPVRMKDCACEAKPMTRTVGTMTDDLPFMLNQRDPSERQQHSLGYQQPGGVPQHLRQGRPNGAPPDRWSGASHASPMGGGRPGHMDTGSPANRNVTPGGPQNGRISLPRKRSTMDEDDTPSPSAEAASSFTTAYDRMVMNNMKKNGGVPPRAAAAAEPDVKRRTLGTSATSTRRKFVSPLLTNREKEQEGAKKTSKNGEEEIDERLRNIDPKMVEAIMNEIMEKGKAVTWDDIAGLEHAKATIQEVVVWPMLRPDIFTGIRGPPKGLLLFGPPGTGKTLIGKCIASQSGATFFSISSSSLTSKWVGDGEKMVRALFAVARVHQPSVIFIDEIDSLLTQRTDGEFEATRRIKTEFLVQFDGCGTDSDDRILMIGATNRPHEIDEAARRRFRKKLYIPLPESPARLQIINNLLSKQNHSLSSDEIAEIVNRTDGYSGSDVDGLVREAALGPIRDIRDIKHISVDDVRPITFNDFVEALTQVRASVSDSDLTLYTRFDSEYGSVSKKK